MTADPHTPVQFARATLERLGLASRRTLDAYEALFDPCDLVAFPILMPGQVADPGRIGSVIERLGEPAI